MKPQKFVMLMLVLVISLLLAACGGGGGSTTNTTTGDTPEAVAKSFFDKVFIGEDVANLLCASNAAAAQAIKDGMAELAGALAASGAAIDTSGLAYKVLSTEGDDAVVEVTGALKATVAGQSVDQQLPALPVPLKRENGAWKICGE